MNARVTAGFICEADTFHEKMVKTQRPTRIVMFEPVRNSSVNTNVQKHSMTSFDIANLMRSQHDISDSILIKFIITYFNYYSVYRLS